MKTLKVSGFTIIESLVVLVLSGIVFAVILNAHQIINRIYALNISSSKQTEHIVEMQKLIDHETFHSDAVEYSNRQLIFETEDRSVIISEQEHSGVLIQYRNSDNQYKEMSFDTPFEILDVKRNKYEKVTSLVYRLMYLNEWQTFTINKNYTSTQKMKWIED